MGIFETLHGVSSTMLEADGTLESCMLTEENTIETGYGPVIPKWQEDVRKKNIPSISFYPDGTLKSVALEQQQLISTPLGTLPAEFITFYPDGALRRVFPCNGKITAYWSEEEEAALCPSLSFSLPVAELQAKLTAIHFYHGGALNSMSLWPGETVSVRTPQGSMPTRIGFSLHEDGSLQSMEPPYPIDVTTPIGVIPAFDPDALGIHGDSNSLSFLPDGSIQTVTTMDTRIEIIQPGGQSVFFGPTAQSDPLLDDQFITIPVRLSFEADHVTPENAVGQKRFSLTDCGFRVIPIEGDLTGARRMNCGDCSTCNKCG
ncbi:MAG: hypothetical protein H6Q60_1286 [Oscillospiraceae bacterium]|nr:hypothetical protein [Oscillospiraceae bacterium]